MSFQAAVEAADHLVLKPGLSAVKKGEGKARIVQGSSEITGSVAMDDDCRRAYPNDARWDYVIGVQAKKTTTAFFVEVHSAETSEVRKMEAKLEWLLQYLQGDSQEALRKLPRQLHWVASGRVNIPRNTPQFKRLRNGLLGQLQSLPTERLQLP